MDSIDKMLLFILTNALHYTYSLKGPDFPEVLNASRHTTLKVLVTYEYLYRLTTDWWCGGCSMNRYLSI